MTTLTQSDLMIKLEVNTPMDPDRRVPVYLTMVEITCILDALVDAAVADSMRSFSEEAYQSRERVPAPATIYDNF